MTGGSVHTPQDALNELLRTTSVDDVWDLIVLGAHMLDAVTLSTMSARMAACRVCEMEDHLLVDTALGWCDGATELTHVIPDEAAAR